MNKETISFRQAIYSIILFIFGSSVVLGVNETAGQDAWISLLLATAGAFPLYMMYARIIRLYPETDFYDIILTVFGKIIGKVLIGLFTWYAIHLAAIVIRNFSEFLQIVSMPETPELPLMAALALVTAYLAKSSTSVLGKWSVIMLPIVSIVVLLTLILSVKDMDLTNLLPILENGWKPVAEGAYQIITFPFAEVVVFLCLAGSIKKQDNPYKIYGYSLLAGSVFLLLVILRNFVILGPMMVNISYFSSYTTARILRLGDFLSRIEGTITINFLLSGILKITVCLIAGAKGIAKLFNITVYKNMLMPASMLALALCAIIYKSAMEMFGFIQYYQFYAIPFQIVIPLAVWIAAEVTVRKKATA